MKQSPSLKEACFHGCCTAPFLLPDAPPPSTTTTTTAFHHHFVSATTSTLLPHTQFTDPESLPPLQELSSSLLLSFPHYSATSPSDQIRSNHYYNLVHSKHVCLDYIGHGLFSFSQQQQITPSSSPSSSLSTTTPFFDLIYKSPTNLNSQDTEFESIIKKRVAKFMNISEEEYAVIFTANISAAFKLVAETYPFHSNQNLVTVYDFKNEAVEMMVESCKKNGAKVGSAEFSWPSLRINSRKLRKKITGTRNKGLFVFPLQSRASGSRYSYMWMSLAHEKGWHVLLDASALGPKDMETLGLSLFRPDFVICSFYKVFGENPSGFGCLFVKKSTISILKALNPNTGLVSLVRTKSPFGSEIEFDGLDHADSLGLILISSRTRCLVNWLVNALMNLRHPNSENGGFLVRVYGPRIRVDRGPAVAFNVFDWKGEKVEPELVQKLADRNNISVGYGFLHNILVAENYKATTMLSVITVSIGYLTDFEDVYRLWAFVSRFLDADFMEKERWRYTALNQTTVEV